VSDPAPVGHAAEVIMPGGEGNASHHIAAPSFKTGWLFATNPTQPCRLFNTARSLVPRQKWSTALNQAYSALLPDTASGQER
jgi:hypothetical protein